MKCLIDADVLEYRNGGLYWTKPEKGRTVGRRVGTVNGSGYRQLTFNGVIYLEHRVIWGLHKGDIPDKLQIDHKDRDPSNNYLENLRLTTVSGNQLNKGRGYSYCNYNNKFRARYCPTIDGKQTTVTIGYFDTPEEASDATAKYKEKLYAEQEGIGTGMKCLIDADVLL